jgi:chromosome segregation ATPase
MNHFFSTVGAVIVLATTCVACDKVKPPQPQLQQPPATSGQINPKGEQEAFSQAAQKELDDLRNVIAGLRARAGTANLQSKARLGEEVEKLEAELGEAQQRLMELKSVSAESWGQLKESFGKSLGKLKDRIDSFPKNAG